MTGQLGRREPELHCVGLQLPKKAVMNRKEKQAKLPTSLATPVFFHGQVLAPVGGREVDEFTAFRKSSSGIEATLTRYIFCLEAGFILETACLKNLSTF